MLSTAPFIALVNNERPPLPDLDKPVAVGLKVSVLDKLLPDADKPSTVGLEVEGLAVFGLDVVGKDITKKTVWYKCLESKQIKSLSNDFTFYTTYN